MDLLLKEMMERLNDVLSDLKELKKENNKQTIDTVNIKRDIKEIENKLKAVEKLAISNEQYLKTIETRKVEITGFIKIVKYLWIPVGFAVGYIAQYITWTVK